MVFDKLKGKVLNSSDMYNHYKSENEILSKDLAKEIEELKKEIKSLKKENKKLKKQGWEYERIFKSNTFLFNKLFVDFDLQSGGLIRAIQELDMEVLNLTDIICKKYGFEYWIDYGNLLGACRHKGFIPWDDDLDVSMMRKDYNEFLEVLDDAIKDFEPLKLTYARLNKPTEIMAFSQLTYNVSNAKALAGIDFFTLDYITSPPEDIEKTFKQQKDRFHIDLIESTGKETIEKSKEERISFAPGEIDVKGCIEKSFDSLNITYEKTDYIIPGIEGVLGGYVYPFILFEYDDIFPLGEIEFENKTFPCINNIEKFLSLVYGEDYMFVPRKVHFHERQRKLRYIPNIEEIIKENIIKIREFNSTI